MNFRILAAIALVAVVGVSVAKAEIFVKDHSSQEQGWNDAADSTTSADDRLMIVNGNNGHVIYDDGKDDLFCVTRRVVVGYNEWGQPIRRRTMHCR
jgi:hypothetical protein